MCYVMNNEYQLWGWWGLLGMPHNIWQSSQFWGKYPKIFFPHKRAKFAQAVRWACYNRLLTRLKNSNSPNTQQCGLPNILELSYYSLWYVLVHVQQIDMFDQNEWILAKFSFTSSVNPWNVHLHVQIMFPYWSTKGWQKGQDTDCQWNHHSYYQIPSSLQLWKLYWSLYRNWDINVLS